MAIGVREIRLFTIGIPNSISNSLPTFTKSFAAEAYRFGVRVNAIAPGLIDTDMSAVFEGSDPEEPIRHTALGRKIYPDEISDVVIALLSEKMKIFNGEVIYHRAKRYS